MFDHVDRHSLLGLLHSLVLDRANFVLLNRAEALLGHAVLGHFCFQVAIRSDRATRFEVAAQRLRGTSTVVRRVTLSAQ